MVRDLESHKRHAFLVALPNVSKPTLERKAASLRQHTWLVAMVACRANPRPVPGLPEVACDLYMLTRALEGYRHSFGLDGGSLVRLAEQTGQPLHKILQVLQGPEDQGHRGAGGRAAGSGLRGCLGLQPETPQRAHPGLPGLLWPVLRHRLPDAPHLPGHGSVMPRACWFRPLSKTPTAGSWMVSGPSPEPRPARGGSEGLGACRLCLCPGWGGVGGGEGRNSSS